MGLELIRVPPRHQGTLKLAREKRRKLREKGIDRSLFDIMMDLSGKDDENLFKGFKL